jgi:hypothetical protein
VEHVIAETTEIAGRQVRLTALPAGIVLRRKLGLVTSELVDGQVVHEARDAKAGLYETKAVITPGGDFLLMMPDGGHYGFTDKKNNDLLAFRSRDQGRTWSGPTVAFDIDYSQHGFVPLIPRGSKRLYAFGTQPIPGMYTRERGQAENAPIGYRYSDDDGRTWSEVRIIRPVNDPGFRGMSVMRMCETEAGTWLIGSHEGDWSYKPLITRQYILRSTDQGATWTLLPGERHGGWHCPGFGRMDEGRPINLGGGKVLLMTRTPEGHLWELRSNDDGLTWTEPRPTALVHPDAPPMLFHLSDGKTLAAFHHNRHHDKNYRGLDGNPAQMMDRSELWVSLSTDDGGTWSAPRFVSANALAPSFNNAWRNYNCSYCDVILDAGNLHIFMPHRWERCLHLTLREADLQRLPQP